MTVDKDMFRQLGSIYRNQPLFPGDTMSHQIAGRCRKLGYIKRNKAGSWITTLRGRLRYWLSYKFTRIGA